jgi:hypothetical protein
MMYITHMMRCKSLRSRTLDGGADEIRMEDQSLHLAQGTTRHPPRARVTATAKLFQREGFNFRVHCRGFSHF